MHSNLYLAMLRDKMLLLLPQFVPSWIKHKLYANVPVSKRKNVKRINIVNSFGTFFVIQQSIQQSIKEIYEFFPLLNHNEL